MTASLYQSGSFMRCRSTFHLPCHGKAQLILAGMLSLFALPLGVAAGEQQAASGTFLSADEIAATLKQSIANNTVDQPIKLAELPGGHKASVAMLRRTKAETDALIHDYVTELYQ